MIEKSTFITFYNQMTRQSQLQGESYIQIICPYSKIRNLVEANNKKKFIVKMSCQIPYNKNLAVCGPNKLQSNLTHCLRCHQMLLARHQTRNQTYLRIGKN